MRQTIGGTWLLQLMIVFILLFVGFMILTLNYSKAVKIKNETLSIIEKYEGLNEPSISLVNNFLKSSNYYVTGACTSEDSGGIYGALSLDVNYLEPARADVKYYYCIKKFKGKNNSRYYQVTLFYKFNLPVIGDASRFMIKGTTTNFHPVDDKAYEYTISD